MTKSENSNMGKQLDELIKNLENLYKNEENKSEFLTDFKDYLYDVVEEKKITKVLNDPKNTLSTALDIDSTIKGLLNEIKKEYKVCDNKDSKKDLIKSIKEMIKEIKEYQDAA